jgi:hypothetical protein
MKERKMVGFGGTVLVVNGNTKGKFAVERP